MRAAVCLLKCRGGLSITLVTLQLLLCTHDNTPAKELVAASARRCPGAWLCARCDERTVHTLTVGAIAIARRSPSNQAEEDEQ